MGSPAPRARVATAARTHARTSLVLALGITVGMAATCIRGGTFLCGDDVECREGVVQGTCEATGFCSFPDAGCESGARYSRFAGDGLARACADRSPGTSGAGTSSTGADDSGTADLPAPDLGPPAVREPHEITCGDGLVEADEACDDGNLLDGDGCNHDCVVSGTPLWTVMFNGEAGGEDYAYALGLMPSGDLVVTGRTAGEAGDVWMARYDPETGENLRSWQYSTPLPDEGRAIVADADARIYVVGTSENEANGRLMFVRVYYDTLLDGGVAGGNVELRWSRNVNSPGGADDRGYAAGLRPTAEGDTEIVAAGVWGNAADPEHPGAHARGFPITGEVATWFTAAGVDTLGNETRAAAVTDDGRVFVGGVVRTATGNVRTDGWFGEIDLEDPVGPVGFAWTERVGIAAEIDAVDALALHPDGMLLVGGHVDLVSAWGIWTLDGSELQRNPGLGPEPSEIHGIAADGTGAVVTVGYRTTRVGQRDIEVVKYEPGGAVLWTDAYDGASHQDDRARAVVIDDDDAVYVAGHARAPASDADIWIRKYAP